MAEHHAGLLIDALKSGSSEPIAYPGYSRTLLPLRDIFVIADEGSREYLRRAMHLSLSGKYDAANVEILKFAAALAQTYGIEMAKSAEMPHFAQTFCAQCGRQFGPGRHGFSRCGDHAGMASKS